MTDRELLEALEEINKLSIGENAICLPAEIDEAMDALRERLAQPEQEPLQFKCTVIDDAHPNGVPLEQWGKQPEQEPVTLPCCGYADASAVKWNPYSKAVQCHNCGQTYTPLAQPEQEPVAHVYFLDYPSGRPRVAWDNANNIKIGDKLYTAPPQRKPLPPQSPCEMTQAEGKMFKLGWLECEAAHGIKGEA